jgi:hypothetical protein
MMYRRGQKKLLLRRLDRSVVDTLDDVVGVLTVNGATDRLGSSEDLLGASSEGLGERLGLHDSAGGEGKELKEEEQDASKGRKKYCQHSSQRRQVLYLAAVHESVEALERDRIWVGGRKEGDGEYVRNVPDLVKSHVSRVSDVLLLLSVTRGLLEGLDDEGGSGGNDRGDGLSVLDGQLDGDLESLPVAGGLGNVLSDLLGGLLGRWYIGKDSWKESTEGHVRRGSRVRQVGGRKESR